MKSIYQSIKENKVHWLECNWKEMSVDEYVRVLEKENRKLKETIKDHQLYEEKLEHRIVEFEELLHWE